MDRTTDASTLTVTKNHEVSVREELLSILVKYVPTSSKFKKEVLCKNVSGVTYMRYDQDKKNQKRLVARKPKV